MNIQEYGNNYSNNFNSFKIPNSQTFSREYVYEIKVRINIFLVKYKLIYFPN